jgi:translocation and assembly module TamA
MFYFKLTILSILLINWNYSIYAMECSSSEIEDSYAYIVEFNEVEDEAIVAILKNNSHLIELQNSAPSTIGALKRRIEEDTSNLLKVLQSHAYYQAQVSSSVDEKQTPFLITLTVTQGPLYPFSGVNLVSSESSDFSLSTILPCELGIISGEPALPTVILKAEDTLLEILEKNGYPLAKISKREVIADQLSKTISVIFYVNTGETAYFGETDLLGATHVLPEFFNRKIAWQPGERYSPDLVDRTLNALEGSGLFSSIHLSHEETLEEDGTLTMQINVKEAKHRSLGFGIGYATDLGPGVNAEWEHRNMRGMGEKLSLVANIWAIKQEGFIRYIQPDFAVQGQDLIWKAEVEHEKTKGFIESSASFSATIERQWTDHLRTSYGGMFTLLRNTHSNNNRDFNLFKLPMQLLWSRTNSLLDPTIGWTVHIKTTPALQTLAPRFAYSTHWMTATAYQALDADHRFVLAAKATLGSIWGASKHSIPPSERFYAGSDTLLRGYSYLTVSPLNEKNKPIGGRSLMVYSLEARMRIWNSFGLVAFYDLGNVYSSSIPRFDYKQLQSVGVGLRYYTPVGPLRLDLAFPLNPRRHVDSSFQLYFSIGQSF